MNPICPIARPIKRSVPAISIDAYQASDRMIAKQAIAWPADGVGPRSLTRWRKYETRSNRSASRNRTSSVRNWPTAHRSAIKP